MVREDVQPQSIPPRWSLQRVAGALASHLDAPPDAGGHQVMWYGGAASLLAAAYGLAFLAAALAGPTLAAWDTHQHVYWMWRYLDPGLFPGDPHTDYFQAVAPAGYAALYRLAAGCGLDPLLTSKLLPIPIAIATAAYAFVVTLRVYPVPAAAFAASVLFTQYAWMNLDLPTATPRAFLYPALLAFLYHLLARQPRRLAAATAATAAFYPQYLLLELAVLAAWPWRWRGGPRLAASRSEAVGLGAAAAIATAGLLAYAYQTAQFGPVVSPSEARAMVEFGDQGFRRYFTADPVDFWLFSFASGYFPYGRWGAFPPLMLAAIAFPLLWAASRRFPVRARLSPDAPRLWALVAASTGLFLLAHATVFRLYYPARYTGNPIGLVVAIAAAITATAAAAAFLRWAARSAPRAVIGVIGVALAGGALLAPPGAGARLPNTGILREGRHPALYAFLARQPKDALIASLSAETEFIPMFARRPVLVANTMNPYHLGFYRPIERALEALVAAQYATTAAEVRAFLRAYRVAYLLLDRGAFEPAYLGTNEWLRQGGGGVAAARARMARGARFVLQEPDPRAIAFENEALILLDARFVAPGVGNGRGR